MKKNTISKKLTMTSATLLSIGCLAVTLPIVSNAANNDKFKLGTKENITSVSGYPGTWRKLGNNGPYQGLYGLLWGEKTDDPCALLAWTRHLNKHSSLLGNGLESRDLDNTLRQNIYGQYSINNRASLEAEGIQFGFFANSGKFSSKNSGNLGLHCGGNGKSVYAASYDQYIYKLNVCTTDKKRDTKNKLKGLRVWVRTLVSRDYKDGDSPQLIDEPTGIDDVHTHCKDWHRPAACAKGEIATGIRLHHNGDWATGIALYCKKLKLKPRPGKPTLTPTLNDPV